MKNSGRLLRLSLVISAAALLPSSCTDTAEDGKTISLTFIQHTLVWYTNCEELEHLVYYFDNDVIAKTVLEYEKGYYVTQDDIQYFKSGVLNYVVPQLTGGGYWSYTDFMTDFDEETGLSKEAFQPQELSTDLTLHFGIHG